MCVVLSFRELEDAMRRDAREVLVIGHLAAHLKDAIASPDGQGPQVQSFLEQVEHSYTIKYREFSRCVPVILQHNECCANISGKCENCDC